MTRFDKLPIWASVLVIGLLAAGLSLYVPYAHPGISHTVAARTYLFWALVTAPIAFLAEMLARTVVGYPFVKRLIARISTEVGKY